MTRKSKREIEQRLADLGDSDLADMTVSEAYALLVKLASSNDTEADRRQFKRLPDDVRETVTPPANGGEGS